MHVKRVPMLIALCVSALTGVETHSQGLILYDTHGVKIELAYPERVAELGFVVEASQANALYLVRIQVPRELEGARYRFATAWLEGEDGEQLLSFRPDVLEDPTRQIQYMQFTGDKNVLACLHFSADYRVEPDPAPFSTASPGGYSVGFELHHYIDAEEPNCILDDPLASLQPSDGSADR